MTPIIILPPMQQRKRDILESALRKDSPLVIKYQIPRRIMKKRGVKKSRIPTALKGALSGVPSGKTDAPCKNTNRPLAIGTIIDARAAVADAIRNRGVWFIVDFIFFAMGIILLIRSPFMGE